MIIFISDFGKIELNKSKSVLLSLSHEMMLRIEDSLNDFGKFLLIDN